MADDARYAKFVSCPEALLAAVAAAWSDDAPRLACAAWYDAHAEPRGELIRLQCDGGSERRIAELLDVNAGRWTRYLDDAPVFLRGFLDAINFRIVNASSFHTGDTLAELLRMESVVRDVTIRLAGADASEARRLPGVLEQIAQWPLDRLGVANAVHLSSTAYYEDDSRGFMDHSWSTSEVDTTDAVVRDLCGWAMPPPGLSALALPGARLTAATLAILLESPLGRRVDRLDLEGNISLGGAGAIVVAQAQRPWRHLSLPGCGIDDDGAHALANSERLVASIATLDLRDNAIGAGGRQALVARFGDRVRLG